MVDNFGFNGGGSLIFNEMLFVVGEVYFLGGWDNLVGKVGLGKMGRVINWLVLDNELLKRDIKIERLRVEDVR